MDERITFRPDEKDREILKNIREHLTETIGEPSHTDIVRYALRAAGRELARSVFDPA